MSVEEELRKSIRFHGSFLGKNHIQKVFLDSETKELAFARIQDRCRLDMQCSFALSFLDLLQVNRGTTYKYIFENSINKLEG
jgi:hypothetical protein